MALSGVSLIVLFANLGMATGQIEVVDKSGRAEQPTGITRAGSVWWAKKARQGFNMRVWMSNQAVLGIEAWAPLPVPIDNCIEGIGLQYPADACFEHLFGAGPAIGAIINGVRRVAEGYNTENGRSEFVPDAMDSLRDRIWQTSIDTVNAPNKRGMDDDLDRKIDEDHLDGLDNDLSFGVTDTALVGPPLGHIPLGIKLWQKSYAWKIGSSADAIVFLDYAFVYVGRNILNDVYIGMFADMDISEVGPTDQPAGYVAYDSLTRTAYGFNPAVHGSTPLGISFLSTTKSLDSLRLVFQWYEPGSYGTDESLMYSWISGEAFAGQLIKPDQDTNPFLQTRLFLSAGPFQNLHPGDTVKAVFAFVSGASVGEMLSNAQRLGMRLDSLPAYIFMS